MFYRIAEQIAELPFSVWVSTSTWIWPTMEILHFVGLSLLLGSLLIIDLRMAGYLSAIQASLIERLLPWTLVGFGMNLVTGVLFFVGDPTRYIVNVGFQIKILLILIAGLNAIFYYWRVRSTIGAWDPDVAPPLIARTIAYVSISTWTAVLLLGRLIPYVGTG